jgi:hypothetical protein
MIKSNFYKSEGTLKNMILDFIVSQNSNLNKLVLNEDSLHRRLFMLETLQKNIGLIPNDILHPERFCIPGKSPHHFTYGVINDCLLNKNMRVSYITSIGKDYNLNRLQTLNPISFGIAGPTNESVLIAYEYKTVNKNINDYIKVCTKYYDKRLPLFNVQLGFISLGYEDTLIDLSKLHYINNVAQIYEYYIKSYETPSHILPPLDSVENQLRAYLAN